MTSSPSQFAYVALIMKGNSYIPGLQALCASLRASKTIHDIVCLYTPDVDNTLIAPHVTSMVQVPYLQFETHQMATPKQQAMYDSWREVSYTKWHALDLVQYEKILFCDLDIIVLENLDHLFELSAPAATFSNAWAAPYLTKGLSNPYQSLKHGQAVDPAMIQAGLASSFVLIATTVLLKPCRADFVAFCQAVAAQQPFGFKGCKSAFDEQSLAQYYLKHWTHISQRYNIIPWHANSWLAKDEVAAVHHFFGEKPWDTLSGKYEDLKRWWAFYEAGWQVVPASQRIVLQQANALKQAGLRDSLSPAKTQAITTIRAKELTRITPLATPIKARRNISESQHWAEAYDSMQARSRENLEFARIKRQAKSDEIVARSSQLDGLRATRPPLRRKLTFDD